MMYITYKAALTHMLDNVIAYLRLCLMWKQIAVVCVLMCVLGSMWNAVLHAKRTCLRLWQNTNFQKMLSCLCLLQWLLSETDMTIYGNVSNGSHSKTSLNLSVCCIQKQWAQNFTSNRVSENVVITIETEKHVTQFQTATRHVSNCCKIENRRTFLAVFEWDQHTSTNKSMHHRLRNHKYRHAHKTQTLAQSQRTVEANQRQLMQCLYSA